ncbi:MAG: PAS domain S-box protein, partial [Bacteroidota bacterium]
DSIVAEHKELFQKTFASAMQRRKGYSLDIRFQLSADKIIDSEMFLSPLWNETESVQFISVLLKDITERRRTELQLLRFANAIHYTVNPVQITDVDGKMIYVNPSFERTTGYSKEDLIGADPRIISSGKHPPEFWRDVWKQILGGKMWHGQIINKKKTGELIYTQLIISPIVDPSGKVVGFLGTHRDLTEQKKLETELQSTEQYLATILRNSGDAIIGIDLENRVASWNKGAEDIFGYTEEEILGKPFLVLVPPDLLAKQELETLAAEVYKKGVIRSYETERLTKKGDRIAVSLSSSVIRDPLGNIIGRSAILRDITAIKVLFQQIIRAEKLSVIGQLAAGLAHEVGNPLTSISSLVQVIQRTTRDQFAQEKLELVKNQINRIAKILRDLVDFARPSVHEVQDVNINDTVREAMNMVRYGKKAKHIRFELHTDESLAPLRLVPDQLHQVLVNLLINAVDAVGKRPGTITVRTRRIENKVSIEVSDSGRGIEKEAMSKMFEPFYTTKPVGQGIGLGLSIS